ncbi:MAG: hypothetical protein DRH26_02220 [Deltaproteobacteria bacterium]|nr:MAG: hypothetical protein DRH26_02220 [Deltaproteobacteria bacterium]
MDAVPKILDACCGSKMMWGDRKNPRVIFGDNRAETITVTDRSHGKADGSRTLIIEPDVMLDFRHLPNTANWVKTGRMIFGKKPLTR